jgi:putative transposase
MMNKRAFITAHKTQYAVPTFCRLLEISRGWFYGFLASQPVRDQRQADREARDLEVLPKIKPSSKPARRAMDQNAFTRIYWRVVKLFLNGVWLE